MRKIFLIFTIFIFTNTNTYAGLFGPSSYDDCILDGMKTAKTDLAVRGVYQACRTKFPKESYIKNGQCELYWDGWKLVGGSKNKISGYKTFEIEKDNIYKMEISIPISMYQNFQSSPDGINENYKKFAASHWYDIQSICRF